MVQTAVYPPAAADLEPEAIDSLYKKLTDYYTVEDWNKFGKEYDCLYVFLYDKTNAVLYYASWENFIVEENLSIREIPKE